MPNKKYLIFDAGPLINFAMNGILPVLRKLKHEFDGEFLITKEVKREVIDYPQTLKRFELESLQLEDLFNDKVIKHADITQKQVDELRNKREEIMHLANHTFYAKSKPIHLLDKGECAALALAIILDNNAMIVVDERTTRMLCENPENLRKLLQKKLHMNVTANKNNYEFFKRFRIIRSTELAYIAYKRKLFDLKDPRILDAVLYALKFHGCSISSDEIEEVKKIE